MCIILTAAASVHNAVHLHDASTLYICGSHNLSVNIQNGGKMEFSEL